MNPNDLYSEINYHLLNDKKPSKYLKSIYDCPLFKHHPFDTLYQMKFTKQSPKHHPEGNVWNHTLLVVDQAAIFKSKSKNENVFMWASFLHDIGKPSTTKTKNGKITAYGHDKAGANIAKEFLTQFNNTNQFINDVVYLVRWHMQILFVIYNSQFMNVDLMAEQTDINEVALLGLCDRLGRKDVDIIKEENNIKLFIKKCNSILNNDYTAKIKI